MRNLFSRKPQGEIVPASKPVEASPEVSQEYDTSFLKIPNGRSEEWATHLSAENEPTKEELEQFFKDNPEAVERIVYCPTVNNDETDDWGFFGYGPAFLFIAQRDYTGPARTLSERDFEQLVVGRETPSGRVLPVLRHYDFWPRNQFKTQIVRPGETPRTFEFIAGLFGETPDAIDAPRRAIGAAALHDNEK